MRQSSWKVTVTEAVTEVSPGSNPTSIFEAYAAVAAPSPTIGGHVHDALAGHLQLAHLRAGQLRQVCGPLGRIGVRRLPR